MYKSQRNIWIALTVACLGLVPGTALADDNIECGPLEQPALIGSRATKRCNTRIEGFSIRAGVGITAVNASLAQVRQTVFEYGHYADFMPRFIKSRVVGKEAGSTDVYLKVAILHGAASVWAVTRFSPPSPEGAGERIEGHMHNNQGNVDDLRAVWHLTPIDADHTIVRLELLIVPSFPVLGSLVTPELEFASDQAVTATRDRTEARVRQAVAQQTAPVDAAAH